MRNYYIRSAVFQHAVEVIEGVEELKHRQFKQMLKSMFDYACINSDYDNLTLSNGEGEELAKMETVQDGSRIFTTLYIRGDVAVRQMVIAE